MFGSVRLAVRPSACLWMGVLRKTMTHGMQSKISVCLSVIRKCSRSRAAHCGRGLLILFSDEYLMKNIIHDSFWMH